MIIMTAVYILFTTLGITFFKLGGDSLTISLKNGLSFSAGYLTILGLSFYVVSFLLWQKILSGNDLSYIVPITTGIVQIVILLISFFIFKESISMINLLGIILVIVGIVLISK